MSRLRHAALALASAALAPACAIAPKPLPAILQVRATPPAELFVDDVFAGAAARPVALRPGFHRVELRADGMFPAYREVTLRPGERATLDVRLRPDLDAPASEAPDAPAAPRR